jgi:hypothetical protein
MRGAAIRVVRTHSPCEFALRSGVKQHTIAQNQLGIGKIKTRLLA